MPPIDYKDTAVVDEPWDASKEVGAISNVAKEADLKPEYAWVDPGGDANAKASYKLPHHKVEGGKATAANVSGVRAALSRLPQTTGIPRADFDGIRAHLNKHLDKWKAQNPSSTSMDDDALQTAMVVEAEGHVWAIKPEMLAVLSDLHGHVVSDVMYAELQALGARTSRSLTPVGGVATIPLKGMLMPQVSILALLFGGGGSGLLEFRSQLLQAAADPEVKSIVMDVDSPGGYVDMIPEIAADIRAAGEQKPIVAVANTMAASAAYWLASQAHEVVVTPSGEIGSIGVYQIHMDQSGRLAAAGVMPTIVKAGKYKIEANPYNPLSEDGQAQMQEGVDDYYDMFVNDVAAGRGVDVADVKEGYGEGRVLTSKRAVKAGLADRVATLSDTVARLASGRSRVRRTSGDDGGGAGDGPGDENFAGVVYTPAEREAVLALARLR